MAEYYHDFLLPEGMTAKDVEDGSEAVKRNRQLAMGYRLTKKGSTWLEAYTWNELATLVDELDFKYLDSLGLVSYLCETLDELNMGYQVFEEGELDTLLKYGLIEKVEEEKQYAC